MFGKYLDPEVSSCLLWKLFHKEKRQNKATPNALNGKTRSSKVHTCRFDHELLEHIPFCDTIRWRMFQRIIAETKTLLCFRIHIDCRNVHSIRIVFMRSYHPRANKVYSEFNRKRCFADI